MIGDAAFESLIANSAHISNLTSHQVVVTNNGNVVQGGLVSGNSTVANKTVGDIRL
jgi:hypothetical protein